MLSPGHKAITNSIRHSQRDSRSAYLFGRTSPLSGSTPGSSTSPPRDSPADSTPGTEDGAAAASANKEATPPSPPRDAAEPEPEVGGGDSAAATAAADPRRAAATLQRGETLLEPTPL